MAKDEIKDEGQTIKRRKKVRFTAAFIKELKPEANRYIIREDAPHGEKGFCIRVTPKGSKSWFMIYTYEGDPKWLKLGAYPGMSLATAKEEFRNKLKILAEGIDPGEAARKEKRKRKDSWNVDKLCDEFLEKYAKVRKRPRSAREDELNLARDVRPSWGRRKARDIQPEDVVDLLDAIMARGAKIQANRTLATVRKMFAWALQRKAVAFNPAAKISNPSDEVAKDRNLSLEDITTIWREMDSRKDVPVGIKKALKLILLTGLRPGEVLGAQWGQLNNGWLEFGQTMTKNKRQHRSYLSSMAWEVIGNKDKGSMIKKDDGTLISVNDLSRYVRRCNYFGIDPWTPHDLRRTITTKLAEMKVNSYLMKLILNHAEDDITNRVYNQYHYSEEIIEALENWGEKVKEAISNEKTCAKVIPLFAARKSKSPIVTLFH